MLSNLTSLSIYSNHLSGRVPSGISLLSQLQLLLLSRNDLSGQLPSELGRLQELQTLSLHGTRLSGPNLHNKTFELGTRRQVQPGAGGAQRLSDVCREPLVFCQLHMHHRTPSSLSFLLFLFPLLLYLLSWVELPLNCTPGDSRGSCRRSSRYSLSPSYASLIQFPST